MISLCTKLKMLPQRGGGEAWRAEHIDAAMANVHHLLQLTGGWAAPAADKIWVAARGEGVTCNNAPLSGSTRLDFTGSRVPADELPRLDADLVTVTKPNSIAMRMTMVACDRADLVATLRWGHEWDIAAAHLVAQEAGAVVTDALGGPILYNKRKPLDFGLICCAPGILPWVAGYPLTSPAAWPASVKRCRPRLLPRSAS